MKGTLWDTANNTYVHREEGDHRFSANDIISYLTPEIQAATFLSCQMPFFFFYLEAAFPFSRYFLKRQIALCFR